eukprot:499042-Rhodomonas_salina.1
MEVGQRLTSADCPEVLGKANVKEYQQLVGSLNYLVAWTRGDLAFTVSQLSRFMVNPGPSHVAAAKRVLRYAKGTREVSITFTKDATTANQLYAFVDADHAGDPEGRRSVTGFCVMLNGGAVSWESKRQKVMSAMGFEQEGPTPVAEDN